MAEWKQIGKEAALAIHDEVLAGHGGMAGLREEGLLESALAAPQATMFGKPMFEDPVEIAVAYLFYLCKNHPFLDGNKRAALATALVFLAENEIFDPEKNRPLPVDAWESLVLDVASGRLTREETKNRFRGLWKRE